MLFDKLNYKLMPNLPPIFSDPRCEVWRLNWNHNILMLSGGKYLSGSLSTHCKLPVSTCLKVLTISSQLGSFCAEAFETDKQQHDKTLYIQATCKKDFCRPCNEASTQYHFPGLDHHRQSICRPHLRLPSLGHWVVDIRKFKSESEVYAFWCVYFADKQLSLSSESSWGSSPCRILMTSSESILLPFGLSMPPRLNLQWVVWSNQMYDSWRSLQAIKCMIHEDHWKVLGLWLPA